MTQPSATVLNGLRISFGAVNPLRTSLGTTFQFDRRGRVNWIAIGNTDG